MAELGAAVGKPSDLPNAHHHPPAEDLAKQADGGAGRVNDVVGWPHQLYQPVIPCIIPNLAEAI